VCLLPRRRSGTLNRELLLWRCGIVQKLSQWFPQLRIQHPWPNQLFAIKYPRGKPFAGKPHGGLCVVAG
jgi:RNA-directed DNA polymerase